MKTTTYSIDLIIPFSGSKEVVVNSALCVLDAISNKFVSAVIEESLESYEEGALYIINKQESESMMLLFINGAKHIFPAKDGMIFFRADIRQFTYYQNNEWHLV
jgi:hypothetical protein